MREQIVYLVNKYCKYGNLTHENKIVQKGRLIEKYLWVLKKFNDFCNESNSISPEDSTLKVKLFKQYAIDYTLSLNKKLLKMEVKCIGKIK